MFTGQELADAFKAGGKAMESAIALECNKRFVKATDLPDTSVHYKIGYRDALGELLEWIEYDMEKKDV